MNYFEHFEINPAFEIDLNELRRKYYEKSKLIHPDLKSGNVDSNILQTAYNNEAYTCLIDPLTRLKYIIELFHGPLPDNAVQLSPEFLMYVMELHEDIQTHSSDPESKELKDINKQLLEMEQEVYENVKPHLVAFDNGNHNSEIFDELSIYYFKLKYFRRLHQAIERSSVEL